MKSKLNKSKRTKSHKTTTKKIYDTHKKMQNYRKDAQNPLKR